MTGVGKVQEELEEVFRGGSRLDGGLGVGVGRSDCHGRGDRGVRLNAKEDGGSGRWRSDRALPLRRNSGMRFQLFADLRLGMKTCAMSGRPTQRHVLTHLRKFQSSFEPFNWV